jgi:outer membrane protein assembly factor BamA
MKARCTALLALALGGTSAWADDPAPAPAPAPDTPPASESAPAAPAVEAPEGQPADPYDWSKAPPADQASGIELDEPPTPRDKVRDVARALLFVPRWLVWGVAQPVRGTAYVYDHYHIKGLFSSTFYDEKQVYGMYPTASYDTDYGISVGLRGVHHDLFGERERLKLRGDFGGRYRFGYGANLRSGTRFGHRLGLELDFGQERRPNERFYGIGNLDEVSTMPPVPIAPTAAAVSTRFREDRIGGLARATAHLLGAIDLEVTGGISKRESQEASEEDSIENSYMTDQLAGWQEDVQHVQGEIELQYDTRHATNPYMSQAIDATGWYIASHIGRTRGVGGDPSSFDFAGAEAQRFFDLWRGSRILSLRAAVETVFNDDFVSFLDLPRLGGHETLRGYPSSRFRDRSYALGSAEYTWDLGNFLAAYTFVDVGRVYPSLTDFTTEGLRVGYGGGLQLHTQVSYVGRAQIAANKDGDIFFELILSPAFPRRDRIGRF